MKGAQYHSDAPIRLHGRTLVCENKVFSVFLDHVSGAGGHDVAQYLSVVPRHEGIAGIAGVSVLPLMGDRIGLIRVFRHPLRRWAWEVPKGFVDAGETVEQAALRELGEETGYDAKADQLQPLGIVAPEPGVIQGRVQAYAALLNERDVRRPIARGELGHGALQFFRREEIIALVAAGGIEDAATLALMFLLQVSNAAW
jgi:ADP-ribose pyrophosphatase